MADGDRAAALMRQRMMRQNGSIPAGAPPPRQRARFSAPGPSQPVAQPTRPRGLVPTNQVTGYGTKIPPGMDPTNRYKNLNTGNGAEKMLGENATADGYSGLNVALTLVLLILVGSSVFVIPRQFRVFWMFFTAFTVLLMIGFKLYREWMAASEKEGEDKEKYSAWALGILYVIAVLYAVVMVALFFIMAWKIYGVVTSRSNILGSGETPQEATVHTGMSPETAEMLREHREKKKKKHRRPDFM